MKYFLCALLLPFSVQAKTSDDKVLYRKNMTMCHEHFSRCLTHYSTQQIFPDDLKTDEDRAIFYSGCVFALEQLRSLERRS